MSGRIGLMFLKEFNGFLQTHPDLVQFLCVPPEEYVGPAASGDISFLKDLSAKYPIQLHSTSLSIASLDGPRRDWIKTLRPLLDEVPAELLSDHLGFSWAGDYWTGTPLINCEFTVPMARAVGTSCNNVREELNGIPILLENNSYCIDWPTSCLSEGEFWKLAMKDDAFRMLLDIPNLLGRCHVCGDRIEEALNDLPLNKVEQIHVAGGDWLDEYHVGTIARAHSKAVEGQVWDILRLVLPRTNNADVVLERTRNFEFECVISELTMIRNIMRDAGSLASAK
jgi:uncharacterized protein